MSSESDDWIISVENLRKNAQAPTWRHLVFASPQMRMSLFEWPPGTVYQPHAHDDALELYFVVSGDGFFTAGPDGRERLVSGPSALLFPPGTLHGVRVPGPAPLLVLAAVTPNDDPTVGDHLNTTRQ